MVFNGYAIREFRKLHHLSQVELAKRVGISQGHLANVERGHDRLNEDRARLVAREFRFEDLRPIVGDPGPDPIPVDPS